MLICADAVDGACRTAAKRIIENDVRMVKSSPGPPNPPTNDDIVARIPRTRHPRMYLNGDRSYDP